MLSNITFFMISSGFHLSPLILYINSSFCGRQIRQAHYIFVMWLLSIYLSFFLLRCRKFRQNSKMVTPDGGAKCSWVRL